MEQELSNCPSADRTFLSSTFPNTHSLFATNAKTSKSLKQILITKMKKMKKRFLSFLAITMLIATTIQAQIPTNGLVAYYPFSGNAEDSSGNGNNGTNYGASLTTDRFGNANSAYSFNGINSVIVANNSNSLNFTNGSIAFWMQTGSTARMQPLKKGNFDATGEQFAFLLQNTQVQFGAKYNSSCVAGNGWYLLNTTNNYSDNIWHLITSVVNNSTMYLYIDGKLSGTLIVPNSNSDICNGNLHFGTSWNNDEAWYEGKMDDIRIYNRALDSAEIQALFHEGGYLLPVSIEKISASNNDKSITLNWQTATEVNTINFIIQHSANGNSFTNINTEKAIGSGANSYEFTDNSPVNGINYYRLQSVDKDGSSSYSKVVSVNFGDKQTFSIIPNPAKDFASISFSKSVDKATIAVYNITGKQVITQSLNGSTNTYKLNTQTLKNGLYVIKVKTATGNYNEKLLINK